MHRYNALNLGMGTNLGKVVREYFSELQGLAVGAYGKVQSEVKKDRMDVMDSRNLRNERRNWHNTRYLDIIVRCIDVRSDLGVTLSGVGNKPQTREERDAARERDFQRTFG